MGSPWGGVSGYVGKPDLAKGNRSAETVFVNGRWVQNRMLYAAIERGYESLLAHRRFPLAVVHITIDPSLVDVNVHPAKTEIRFRDESDVFRTVMKAVRSALLQADLVSPLGQPQGSGPAGRPDKAPVDDAALQPKLAWSFPPLGKGGLAAKRAPGGAFRPRVGRGGAGDVHAAASTHRKGWPGFTPRGGGGCARGRGSRT